LIVTVASSEMGFNLPLGKKTGRLLTSAMLNFLLPG